VTQQANKTAEEKQATRKNLKFRAARATESVWKGKVIINIKEEAS